MTNDERDRLIIEMHQDIKWLKGEHTIHKAEHSKYVYYFISTIILFVLTWLKVYS